MRCTRCGSARLALALEPGEREPTRVVCLGCGALQRPPEPDAGGADDGTAAAEPT